MDKATASSSLNTTVSSKKVPFSSVERELIVALVRDRPVIEDKRTHAKNIELKKQAWEDLTVAYNSQPYVSQRLTHQLKRCWENIKTQRKKELLQESMSLKRTGGGPPDHGSIVPDNVIDTICPFINLRVPGVIDSNTIEILADTFDSDYAKKLEPDNGNPTVTDDIKKPHNAKDSELENENFIKVINLNTLNEKNNINSRKRTLSGIENEPDENISSQPKRIYNKEIFSTPSNKNKLLSETDARIKRTSINIQQDQALHELRIQREKILIARENNLLEYEKTIQALQIQKAKLEIELLTKQNGNKTNV